MLSRFRQCIHPSWTKHLNRDIVNYFDSKLENGTGKQVNTRVHCGHILPLPLLQLVPLPKPIARSHSEFMQNVSRITRCSALSLLSALRHLYSALPQIRVSPRVPIGTLTLLPYLSNRRHLSPMLRTYLNVRLWCLCFSIYPPDFARNVAVCATSATRERGCFVTTNRY